MAKPRICKPSCPSPNTTMRFAATMASINPSSAFSGMAANTPARSLSAPFDNWAKVSVIGFLLTAGRKSVMHIESKPHREQAWRRGKWSKGKPAKRGSKRHLHGFAADQRLSPPPRLPRTQSSSHSRFRLFRAQACPRQCVANEAVDQLGITDPERLHDLRVHADVGKAWQGVHLIDHETAVFAQKKVDAGQALAAERAEGLDRQLANLVADAGGEISRDLDRRALLVEILGLIGVEAVAVAGHDLTRRRGGERTVLASENAAFDLAAANIFLDEDFAIMPETLGDRFGELLSRPCLADADRRAQSRRLDEHRAAKFGGDRIERWRVPLGEAKKARNRQAAVAHQTFGHILVHRNGRAEDAGTDIRHAGNFRCALDRSILAERAV